MAIMKLVNVPELTEFAGTEKIYVNDNGTTKQIACDKVVTAGGGGSRVIYNGQSTEELVTMIENGDDLWIVVDGDLCKIISFNWTSMCGSGHYIKGTVITGTTVKQRTLTLIFDKTLIERLEALLL